VAKNLKNPCEKSPQKQTKYNIKRKRPLSKKATKQKAHSGHTTSPLITKEARSGRYKLHEPTHVS
jgi:hypothetical protein